ncbi:MAG: hypothetical protein Fur0043_14340 [Anaerolineales bacterium]
MSHLGQQSNPTVVLLAVAVETGTIYLVNEELRYLPNSNRLGVLLATVLLTLALARLIQAPQWTLELQLPGFYFAFPFGLSTAMLLLAAGLSATGMDWVLHEHPSRGEKATIEHWLLPAMATLIVGVPLSTLPMRNVWWMGFGVGALLLTLVFLAEYIVLEPSAPYYAFATIGLTALSYAIYLILVTALRFNGARLFLLLPAIFIVAGLVTLRSLRLRVGGNWQYPWAAGVGLICAQIGAGLHYWPLSPIQYGLALLGPLYALSTLIASLLENTSPRRAILEPLIALLLAWGATAFLR